MKERFDNFHINMEWADVTDITKKSIKKYETRDFIIRDTTFDKTKAKQKVQSFRHSKITYVLIQNNVS